MKFSSHLLASGLTAAGFYAAVPSPAGTAACFLSGIFIDLDHCLDFYWNRRRWTWSLKELEDFCSHDHDKRMVLVLHSFELLLLGWTGTIWLAHPVWIGLLIGVSVHMVLDQLCNGVYYWAYFLLYRARFGFPHKVFFRDEFVRDFLRRDR